MMTRNSKQNRSALWFLTMACSFLNPYTTVMVATGCQYINEHFGPFIEAVIPIQDYSPYSNGNHYNSKQEAGEEELVLVL